MPTGKSAKLIAGVTLLSILKYLLHITDKEMSCPQGAKAESLQANLQGLKYLHSDNIEWVKFPREEKTMSMMIVS